MATYMYNGVAQLCYVGLLAKSTRNVYRAFIALAQLHIYICVTVCAADFAYTIQ